jgi:hypothetical protein
MIRSWKFYFIMVCIAAVLAAGCTDEDLGVTAPATPAVTLPPVTMAPTSLPAPSTLITTSPPVITITATPVKPPLPSPIDESGIGTRMIKFTTVGPGSVQIKINYTSDLGNITNCYEETYSVNLAGKSIDQRLFYAKVDEWHNQKTTFNLISPGDYSLTVRGCYGWKMDVDNAK